MVLEKKNYSYSGMLYRKGKDRRTDFFLSDAIFRPSRVPVYSQLSISKVGQSSLGPKFYYL